MTVMLKTGWRHADHFISHCSGLVYAANTSISETEQLMWDRKPTASELEFKEQRASIWMLYPMAETGEDESPPPNLSRDA